MNEYPQFMFEGERKDGNGKAVGHFFVWKLRYKFIPMIGDGVQNGSVYGHEVIPETVKSISASTGDDNHPCSCNNPDPMYSICHCGKVIV